MLNDTDTWDLQTHGGQSLWSTKIIWPPAGRVVMSDLAREVAAKHGLSVDELRGPKRSRYIAWPRQEFMYLAWMAGKSQPQIGRFLGRDHSTCTWGIKRHKARIGASA